MLHRIEVKNFRILKYINVTLDQFQILVGANATGKTTFLDSVKLVSDIVNNGVENAVFERSSNFQDLTWGRNNLPIEIALEFQPPAHIIEQLGENKDMNRVRYEIKIGMHEAKNEIGILGERVLLLNFDTAYSTQEKQVRLIFPEYNEQNESIWDKKYTNNKKVRKLILNKKTDGNDSFYPETYRHSSGGWFPSFKLGHKKSALANVPEDEEKFPAANWLHQYLKEGVQLLMLDSLKIRKASPPGLGLNFRNDGSNLPWVIDNLRLQAPDLFKDWLRHIRTGLPDVVDISIHEFPDTKHKYLNIHYQNGVKIPSWVVSDGTLRLLALTLLAYLPDFRGMYLIEEPENGIHPKAMETLFSSLTSVYDGQILLASHSSVFLSIAELKHLLCFAKTEEGIADIVKGTDHPKLQNWKGEVNLSMFFAGGVL